MKSPVDYILEDQNLREHFTPYSHDNSVSYTEIIDTRYARNPYLTQENSKINVKHFHPYTASSISETVPFTFLKEFYSTVFDQYSSKYSSYFNSPVKKFSDLSDEDFYFPGVRHIDNGIILFERPPAYHVVSISHDYRDSISSSTAQTEYYIPIPWQIYIAHYNPQDMRLFSVKMFFSNSSLSSLDQTVYTPPLLNFYSNGVLCRPFFASIDDIEKYPKTISGVVASAFDWVWNSGFNYDITDSISFFLGHMKGYFQFAPYVDQTNYKLLNYYNTIRDNGISGFPNNIPKNLVNSFFRVWESVPLEDISSFTWNYITNTENFYFIDVNASLHEMAMQYARENDLQLNLDLYDCDHSCHCEECCDEDEDVYECPNTQNGSGLSLEYISGLVNFNYYYVNNYLPTKEHSILNQLKKSLVELRSAGVISHSNPVNVFNSLMNNISQKLSSVSG